MKLLVPCPHCKQYIELRFENLFWTKNGAAFYRCQSCGCRITENDRFNMLINAISERSSETNQFIFNSLYSPFFSFREIVQNFERCRTDPDKLRYFVKYWLAGG